MRSGLLPLHGSVAEALRLLGALTLRLPRLLWHALSALFPRNRRIWVFFCWDGKRFSDNAKWLFLHCARNGPSGVVPVLLTRSPSVLRQVRAAGLRGHRPKTLRGVWWRLRAGIYVLDNAVGDHLFWGSARAVRVNLWHGIPLKKIGRDIDSPGHVNTQGFRGSLLQRARFRLEHPWDAVRYDMMISTSSLVAERFSRAFSVPRDRIPVTGFPRNDVLLQGSFTPGPWDEAVHRTAEGFLRQGRRLVLYLPTFRDQAGAGDEIPIDVLELSRRMEAWNAIWVFKPHTWDPRTLGGSARAPQGLWILGPRDDVYPVLRHAHVLVTDYSSVYFDFLLLDRPIVFYAYDLREYADEGRGLYERYEDAVPGPVARRFADLLREVELALERPEVHLARWARRREAVRRACHRYRDARASARVSREILRRFVRVKGLRETARKNGGETP